MINRTAVAGSDLTSLREKTHREKIGTNDESFRERGGRKVERGFREGKRRGQGDRSYLHKQQRA